MSKLTPETLRALADFAAAENQADAELMAGAHAHADAWQDYEADALHETALHLQREAILEAQLEAAKAREEALAPLPSGDNRKDAIFLTENGIFLSAHIGDDEETIDSEKFITPADFLKRLAEHRAASWPPGTARPSLGEEGT